VTLTVRLPEQRTNFSLFGLSVELPQTVCENVIGASGDVLLCKSHSHGGLVRSGRIPGGSIGSPTHGGHLRCARRGWRDL